MSPFLDNGNSLSEGKVTPFLEESGGVFVVFTCGLCGVLCE